MKVLFIGLGSIGTRHLNNLCAAAEKRGLALEIDALRYNNRELPPQTAALLNRQLMQLDGTHYDLAFITNPTNLHFDALKQLKGKADALFIEKPIFEKTDYSLSLCIDKAQKAYVAAPMRFCKTFIELKRHLSSISPFSARVICSSYLPDWRKGVDYRTVYSARREMGGGVAIDLIHEWDYLSDLFGFPSKVHSFVGKYSNLEITSDDLAVYIAQYEKLLCEIHLDYFGREYRRSIELFCKNGTVCADFGKGSLTLENGSIIDCAEEVNERYIREINYFLDYALSGAECINTPEHALKVMELTGHNA